MRMFDGCGPGPIDCKQPPEFVHFAHTRKKGFVSVGCFINGKPRMFRTMLGVGIGSFINIFSPEIVAIGGQIAKACDHLIEPARKAARNVAIPSLFKDCEIVLAQHMEGAGKLGGAALAFESLKGPSH